LFSHFQKVQEHSFLICGWQVMIKSFSKMFELQSGISSKPFGQIEWGFLLQVIFDVLYPNPSSQFTKNQPIKMAFFKWLEFKMREVKKWTFKLTISYTFYHLPMFRNQIWNVLKPIFVH
jgi:hypothetical protein